MNIAIVVSCSFKDYESMKEFINATCEKEGITIDSVVSGADTLGERYADEYGLKKLIFRPDWKTYGRKAGMIRSIDIIDKCDVCFTFCDGDNHGTKRDIELCNEKNKKCYIYRYENTRHINEVKGDIFALPKDEYVFAHCIACDLEFGAGIAPVIMKKFHATARWRRPANSTIYTPGDIGVDESGNHVLIHLFTKARTHSLPTYAMMEKCLVNLRDWMVKNDKRKLAIPRIGCGLDKLSWGKVRDIISKTFENTDIIIEVRYL